MSARRVTFTDEQASQFHDYFNAAHEIYDSRTILRPEPFKARAFALASAVASEN